MIHVGQLAAYLHRRFSAGSSSVRVYAEELPEGVDKGLDQKDFDPVICVESRSSPSRGLLTLEQLRFDIFCIAPSFAECHEVTLELRGYMDDLSESGAGAPECVKSAMREAGPIPYRDEDKRRRTVHTSWIVSIAADLP